MSNINVNDMYNYSRTHSLPLLSNFNAEFWIDYLTNYEYYDKLFRRKYFSFRYFLQEEDDTLIEVSRHFIDDVYTHLLANEKRYSELYRINVVDDDTFSIVDNYNLLEHLEKENSITGSSTEGARQDTDTANQGEQAITETNTIAGFNSSGFSNDNKTDNMYGARQDTRTFSKGQQINNTGSDESEEYTLTRKGNIGIKTSQSILDEHKKFWSKWEFYEYIFSAISSELLLV